MGCVTVTSGTPLCLEDKGEQSSLLGRDGTHSTSVSPLGPEDEDGSSLFHRHWEGNCLTTVSLGIFRLLNLL